ncbi:MAG: hypothetical protein ACI4DS_07145 [Eubacterium sp.]
MKQLTILSGCIVIVVLVTISILSISCRSTREFEMREALTVAIEQTLEETCIKNRYKIDSDEEMMAEFIKNFATHINSNSNIKVDFIGVDCENGLLDIKATEIFTYPNGREGKIIVRRMAICD